MAVPAVTSLLQARTGRPFSVSLHLEPRRCAGCAACPNAERKASWRGGQRRGCGAPRAAPCGRHRCCMLSPQPCGRLGRRLDSLNSCSQMPSAVMRRCHRGAAVAQGCRPRSATGSGGHWQRRCRAGRHHACPFPCGPRRLLAAGRTRRCLAPICVACCCGTLRGACSRALSRGTQSGGSLRPP